MLVAAALVPSPPILVPELAGAAADETADLRNATLEAAATLGRSASTWIALGVGDRAETVPPTSAGTYAGFGVDLGVALSPDSRGPADRTLALTALTAAWVRTHGAPRASVEVRTVPGDTTVDECRRYGSALRAEIDASAERVGLLVVADGATTLTPKAPGSFRPEAPEEQARIDRALRTGDIAALAALDEDVCRDLGVGGRAVWQIAAAVFGSAPQATELYSGSPYGVGYFVGVWLP